MCSCDVRSHDGHVMLPWGFGEDGGPRVKDLVGDRLDEGHSDHTDGVGLGQLLHHHRHLHKVLELLQIVAADEGGDLGTVV